MKGQASFRLPDFIAVGPQRTGTTWLDQVLRGHVGLPKGAKETDFFLKHYGKGLKWYSEYFRNCPAGLPVGEIDPNYFGSETARDRIARGIPDCKIICSFRDPVDRAYSSYRTMRRDAWTRVGLEETVANSVIIRESSRYAFHLAQWQLRFGRERVMVCLYDDLEADPQKYLDAVCEFIDVPRVPLGSTSVGARRVNAVTHAPRSRRTAQNARNARDWMREHRWHRTLAVLERVGVWGFCFGRGEEFPPLNPQVEARLREFFLPEIEAFEKLIGRDLSAWKGGKPHQRPLLTASPGGHGGPA